MNKNQLQALIKESGNSDVDVNLQVEIETKSIAYAILCGMYCKRAHYFSSSFSN